MQQPGSPEVRFTKSLSRAMRQSFPLPQNLDRFLYDEMGIIRSQIAPDDTTPVMISNVLIQAKAERWIDQLVIALCDYDQTNPEFQELQKLRIGISPLYERMVVPTNPQLEVGLFLTKLEQLATAVCKIEFDTDEGRHYGTGFMIGAKRLLTNYHVMEPIMKGQAEPAAVRLIFGFKAFEGTFTVKPGNVLELDDDWLIDSSPPSASDLSQQSLPSANELDYALLRVRSTVPSVGEISLPKSVGDPPVGSPLYILHHPKGKPMKLSIESNGILGVNENRTRIKYRTNTDGGSSGAPCFNANLDLVALHHMGDPDWHRPADFNQGIPIVTIADRILAKAASE